MNELIERIYESGFVEDAQGNRYPHEVSSVNLETGRLLYDTIRTLKPQRTLEVGMAYGLSTMFICQAHQDNGSGTHVAIDPFQSDQFKSIGRLNVQKAGLQDVIDFYEEPSQDVLPRLCAANERFDFIFIDGSHRFDYVLVDFFFADRLLDPGGWLALDDLWVPGIRKVASFASRNRAYRLAPPPVKSRPPLRTRVLRLGRRVLQNPLGRDWAIKWIPQNVAFLEKLEGEGRGWLSERAF